VGHDVKDFGVKEDSKLVTLFLHN